MGRPAALLDRLHDELDRALQADVHGLSDDDVLAAAADVYRCEAQLAALKARVVGELDARQAYAAVGAQSAVQWVKHRCRVPGGRARADVLLARSLRHLPVTAAKLADGDIGEAHASAIARQHRNPRTTEAAERAEGDLAEHATKLDVGVVHHRSRLLDPARRSRRRRTRRRSPPGSTPPAPVSDLRR